MKEHERERKRRGTTKVIKRGKMKKTRKEKSWGSRKMEKLPFQVKSLIVIA